MASLVPYRGDRLAGSRAWAHASEKDRRLRAVSAARDRDVPELCDLMESYLRLHGAKGATLSPLTVRAYRLGVRQLVAAWQHLSLLHPTINDAALWLREMEEAGKAPATVALRLAAARTLYKALRWATTSEGPESDRSAGVITADPFADVRPARDPVPAHAKRTPYSDVEIARLVVVASPEDRVLVLLGSHAGLRAAEIVSLRCGDIDPDTHRLHVVGKGRRAGHVEMSRSLSASITALGMSDPLQFLVPYRTTEQARNRLKALCAKAGTPYRSVHSLRHAAGTRLQIQRGDLALTARFLRHSSIETSSRYVHYADDALASSVGEW